jgi:hypothetical protein
MSSGREPFTINLSDYKQVQEIILAARKAIKDLQREQDRVHGLLRDLKKRLAEDPPLTLRDVVQRIDVALQRSCDYFEEYSHKYEWVEVEE